MQLLCKLFRLKKEESKDSGKCLKIFITICFKVFDVKINTILSYLQQQRNIERLNLALGLVTSCHGWRLLAEVCSMSIGDPNKSQKVGVGLKQNFSRE